jgi:hypothetical protein
VTGALTGASGLPERWVGPLRGRLASSIAGFDGIGFDELATRTLALAEPAAPGARSGVAATRGGSA